MLDFAGVAAVEVEVVDIHHHAAEKFHGMLRNLSDRENSRVRDLADVMLMDEQGLLELRVLAGVVREVWIERDGVDPPSGFPALPLSWTERYARIAVDNDVQPEMV